MWLLVLLLSIKLQMPTWYWILFTIFTLIKPILSLIKLYLEDEIKKVLKTYQTTNKLLKFYNYKSKT